jgi:glycosyltransferase involved in cell wall biosynthesis/Tfp pilus assembly protein PilF
MHQSSSQETKIFVSQVGKRTNAPKVSVIIPSYNSNTYIEQAIQSVFKQTFADYEVIVVDDGSTDDTRSKLEHYRLKIRYIYQENQGSAAARNTGISLAKGELIAFLDADDYWLMPEKLEEQVAYFDQQASLGLINTGWRVIDQEGNKIKTVQPWHEAPELNLETWLRRKCVRTSAMMIRRKWLELVGGFDEELRQSHDVDLVLRLALAGCQSAWLKKETVGYRQHDSNTTLNGAKQAKYMEAVLNKFFAYCDLPESVTSMESKVRYHTFVWIAWYQYHRGDLDEMAKYLQKSLNYSSYLRVETLSNWIASFVDAAKARGYELDVDALTDSIQWQQLTAQALGWKSLENDSLPSTFPLASQNQEKQEVASQAKPALQVIKSESVKQEVQKDTFVFYRILGNDLPPRHKKGQTLSNIKFILDHEPQHENCEKRWVLNRIVDREQEKAVIGLLKQYNQTYLHIPFVEAEYAALDFNFEDFPEPDYFRSPSYSKLHDFAKALAVDHTYHHKNRYVMHNNGGRNAALREGKQRAKWVLPWDGNCFLTANAWQQIVEGVKTHSQAQYFIVPMARILNNQDLLDADFQPNAVEEPQIIFRQDAPGEFNENMRYGRLPKIEMLWRLGVPGIWDQWKAKSYPWEQEDFYAVIPDSRFEFLSWVARLSSGMHKQEIDSTQRSWSRFEAVHSMLDSLEQKIAASGHKQASSESNPDLAKNYCFLAERKAEANNLDIAIVFYQRAIEFEPKSWEIRRKLGKAWQKLGKLEQALAVYRQAVEIKPDQAQLHSDIGSIFSQQGKFEEAITYLSRSIELNSQERWSYYKIADAQEHIGQLEAAATNLRAAVQLEPNFSLAYRNLARIQEMLGNMSEAIDCYQQIIKIDPDVELGIYQSLGQALQQNKKVKVRDGLAGIPEKLRNRVCKIAYLGGSATAQKEDGYRPMLHQWLTEYFQQDHQEIKAGNGGMASSAAVFTMDDEVIAQHPDLCFIEYATTDMGKNHQIGAAVEGMVRKLKAINCSVCFLYLYKQGEKFDYTNTTITEYEKVADFYKIPSINVAQFLETAVQNREYIVSDLFKNQEKTFEQGSKVISKFIAEGLKTIFDGQPLCSEEQKCDRNIDSHLNATALPSSRRGRPTECLGNPRNALSRNCDVFLPKSLHPNNYGTGKIVNLDLSFIRDRDRCTVAEFAKYKYYQIDSSNEIKFTLKGKLVGIATIVGKESGIIELITPERTWEYKLWDAFCYQDRFQIKITERDFEKATPIKLKLTDKPIDYSQCREKLADSQNIVKNFKIVGLLVCGEIT